MAIVPRGPANGDSSAYLRERAEAGYHPIAVPSVRSGRDGELRDDPTAVFARLPISMRSLDITVLYGRAPRTKTPTQMMAELDVLYRTGYRGGVFIVDDNFIGNKREVKKLLPGLERWNREHGDPFHTMEPKHRSIWPRIRGF